MQVFSWKNVFFSYFLCKNVSNCAPLTFFRFLLCRGFGLRLYPLLYPLLFAAGRRTLSVIVSGGVYTGVICY